MNRILHRFIAIALCSIFSPTNAQTGSNQIIDLYCEGTDYATYNAKHILVSIDRANRRISITDPLRDTPRVLKLIETRSEYKAFGDHLHGYVNSEKEITPTDNEGDTDCTQGQICRAYLIHTVEFTLNRQSGSFTYLVTGEIREAKTNILLRKVNDWGIFKNSHCNVKRQKY